MLYLKTQTNTTTYLLIMSANENTAASVISASATAAKSVRLIKGMIADSSGHSEFSGTAEDAVKIIQENVQKHNKWVFLDNEPAFPQTDADFRDIRNRMEAGEIGEFTVTAALQGGQVPVKVVKDGVLNNLGKRRSIPQIAVTFDGERNKSGIIITGRSATLEKLKGHKQAIIAALEAAL